MRLLGALGPWLALLGCSGDAKPEVTLPTGEGLFSKGCPVAGEAFTRVLTDPVERPHGPGALARPGDVLLANDRAAFVVQDPSAPRTYSYYGGAPIDAVAVADCAQVGEERFGELAFLLGQLDLGDFEGSTLRMFRGERVEIVHDGSDGGDVIVDVHGVDDVFHLVELELIRSRFLAGRPKALSTPTGLALTMRYTLAPDSDVLGMELRLEGEGDPRGYLAGMLAFPGDTTPTVSWADGALSLGGIGLELGAPWFAAAAPDGAWALANEDGTLARTTISGVTALLDVTHVAEPLTPTAERPASERWLLSLGGNGTPSATAPLAERLDARFPDLAAVRRDVIVRVTDPSGAPVAGARVYVQAATPEGAWRVLDRAWTGTDGTLSGVVTDMGAGLHLVVEADGRDVLTPPCAITATAADCVVAVTAASAVDVLAEDGEGSPLPVRVALTRDDGWRTVAWLAPGDPAVPVPPGTYTARVTHGTTHVPDTQRLVVAEGATAQLVTTLPRAFATPGWLSIDTHIHAEPSADSMVLPPDRFRTAAAGGLDVVVSTDHEIIQDLGAARVEAVLDARVGYALGSEVTATIPEHVNAWPFPPAPEDPRGDFVRWYGLGLGGVSDAARARGAQVVQLNHARVNGSCGILCVVDWDRISGEARVPTMDDLALPAGTPSFDWGFDAYEVMNGLRSPFLRADDPRHSGAFEDWLAFLNHGHPVTAVGVTDVHGEDLPGAPRTWLDVGDDDPVSVPEQALVDAMLEGRAIVSAGAFLDAHVDGAGPGELAVAQDGLATLSVAVSALPGPAGQGIDVTHIEVLVDCDEVADIDATDPLGAEKLATTLDLTLTRDAYVVVVAYGDNAMPDGLPALETTTEIVPRAFTNAIYVDVDGDGVWNAPGGKTCAGDTLRGVAGVP